MTDFNSMGFWFPLIQEAGLPVPDTVMLRSGDMTDLLDGDEPFGYAALVRAIQQAGMDIGWPCFLRTGHGSGKHEWNRTCYLLAPGDVGHHIYELVAWSHMVDMMGLPTDVWAVRRMIETDPICHCTRYGMMPVTREFRMFVRDGKVEVIYPYWPAEAVEQGHPDTTDWRDKLERASQIEHRFEADRLRFLGERAGKAVGGGYWSVDVLEDRHGAWWVTDMAEGERSWRPGD